MVMRAGTGAGGVVGREGWIEGGAEREGKDGKLRTCWEWDNKRCEAGGDAVGRLRRWGKHVSPTPPYLPLRS